MSILITVDSISRRDVLDVFPRCQFKPWRCEHTLPELLQKAANAFKQSRGLAGAVYFQALDDHKWVSYGQQRVLIIVGRVRSAAKTRYALSSDLSGVVEVRLSGLVENFKAVGLEVGDLS